MKMVRNNDNEYKKKVVVEDLKNFGRIQGVNDIDCQKIMGDTSQSTYQKCLIQFFF